MRIALVSLDLWEECGGTRMPYLLAREIEKAGHDITIYTAKFNPATFSDLRGDLRIKEVASPLGDTVMSRGPLEKIKERIRRERLNTAAVKKILGAMDKDYDVVICENDQSYKLGKWYRGKNPKARIVWVMHNAPFRHTPKQFFITNILSIIANLFERLRVRFYLPYIDTIVVNDEEHKKLLQLLGRRARLLFIPVNFEKFYRKISPKTTNQPILLGVGSLSPARNYEDIISAGNILRKSGIDCRIVLVCNNFWKADSYKEKLITLARELDNGEWVDFRFEGVSDNELMEIQNKSFAFIFPNHIRIWGMAAIEAMASGLPLIVSNSTSFAGVFHDKVDALFVNPAHPDEIAERVKFLLDDPKRYESIAKAGQDFVREHFQWSKYVEMFLAEEKI